MTATVPPIQAPSSMNHWLGRMFELTAGVRRGLVSRDQLTDHMDRTVMNTLITTGPASWRPVAVQYRNGKGTFVALSAANPPACTGVIGQRNGHPWLESVYLLPPRRVSA